MKSKKPLDEIIDLKMRISSNEINFYDAVEKFSTLLVNHQNASKIDETFSTIDCMSEIGLSLRNQTLEIDQKIENLNKILVLLELGITFDDEELNTLLK